MPNLTLTTSPQQLVGSNNGVLIKSSSHFTYGFGDTAPSVGIGWATPQLPLDYKGGIGTLWVWADSVDDATFIYYEIAITSGNRTDSLEDAIVRDQVIGSTTFNSFGRYVATGGEVNHIIWPDGVFNIPASAGVQMSIVSTSANDDGSPAGTGIRTMDIHYLDADLNPMVETIVMNGTTAVLTVATNIRFIQYMHILTAGSLRASAGLVTASNGGIVYSQIDIGSRRCASSARMVPLGKVLFIKGSVGSSVSVTADTTAEIKISSTYFEGHNLTDQLIFMPFGSIGIQNNAIPYSFPMPLGPFPAGSIIAMEVSVNKAAIITGDWFGYLENA